MANVTIHTHLYFSVSFDELQQIYDELEEVGYIEWDAEIMEQDVTITIKKKQL